MCVCTWNGPLGYTTTLAFLQLGPWWPESVHTKESTVAMLFTRSRTFRVPTTKENISLLFAHHFPCHRSHLNINTLLPVSTSTQYVHASCLLLVLFYIDTDKHCLLGKKYTHFSRDIPVHSCHYVISHGFSKNIITINNDNLNLVAIFITCSLGAKVKK